MSLNGAKKLFNKTFIVYASGADCPGKYYIPFRDNKTDFQIRTFGELNINQFSRRPIEGTVENNGQRIIAKFRYKEGRRPTLSKGPFGNETYRFEFLYLNWINESVAEQIYDPNSFGEKGCHVQVELHMVFTHVNCGGNIDLATRTNFGVAVLSFRHMVGSV